MNFAQKLIVLGDENCDSCPILFFLTGTEVFSLSPICSKDPGADSPCKTNNSKPALQENLNALPSGSLPLEKFQNP